MHYGPADLFCSLFPQNGEGTQELLDHTQDFIAFLR